MAGLVMCYTGKVPAGLAQFDTDVHCWSSLAPGPLQEHHRPQPSLTNTSPCTHECVIKGRKEDFNSLCGEACRATFNISWLLNRHHGRQLHIKCHWMLQPGQLICLEVSQVSNLDGICDSHD